MVLTAVLKFSSIFNLCGHPLHLGRKEKKQLFHMFRKVFTCIKHIHIIIEIPEKCDFYNSNSSDLIFLITKHKQRNYLTFTKYFGSVIHVKSKQQSKNILNTHIKTPVHNL